VRKILSIWRYLLRVKLIRQLMMLLEKKFPIHPSLLSEPLFHDSVSTGGGTTHLATLDYFLCPSNVSRILKSLVEKIS
jgi:hypothetical protein